jgi:hypothetical protein
VVEVRYDPRNRRVEVVRDAAASPGVGGAPERLEALEELRRRGLVSEEEYQRKRQEMLDAL